MLTAMHNQGPPDLEEWLKQCFRKIVPHKRATLKDFLPPDQQKSSKAQHWLMLSFLVVAAVGMSGVITVKSDENVVVERFGVYQETLDSGMHWIIPFVDRTTIVNLDPQQTTISGLMLTQDHALVNVNVSINYTVVDAKTFAFATQDVNALLQAYLRAASVATLAQENVADLLDQNNWDALASSLQANFNFAANSYGVQIQNIVVNNVAVPDALSSDFNQQISAAQAEVKTMMDAAQQYKDAMVPLATARASQLQDEANKERVSVLIAAKANAAQFNALLPAYQNDPQAVAAYLPLAVSSAKSSDGQDQEEVTQGASGSNLANDQNAYLRWQSASQSQAATDTGDNS